MKIFSKQTLSLTIGLMLSSTVFANFNPVINGSFERFNPNSQSNSGHTVSEECGGTFDGSDYNGQKASTARLRTFQLGNMTMVKITLKDGNPDTLYTVWLRVKGTDHDDVSFGGSPLTNGGATPLAAGSKLDALESISPWNSFGSTSLANGFLTDSVGRGVLYVQLDFPLHGGAYPFNKISSNSLENIRALSNPLATATPTAVVNPQDENINAPFLLRIVSHCQDGLGHGLSPANRETWFNWPAK